MNYYPWYDSNWLTVYGIAKSYVQHNHPDKLIDFTSAFDVFRTNEEFDIVSMPSLFEKPVADNLKKMIRHLTHEHLESYELKTFGRYFIRGIDFVTALQEQIASRVGELVNEPVEPCYNFLSLYSESGVCDVHMDAPFAKWTVDYCIEQSEAWPIHFSRVVPWPEDWNGAPEGWQERIKTDATNRFESHAMQEGDAIIFSGSSQWHYRDPMPRIHSKNFCHLLFFHFIPKGTGYLTKPANWAGLFSIPGLAELHNPTPDVDLNFS